MTTKWVRHTFRQVQNKQRRLRQSKARGRLRIALEALENRLAPTTGLAASSQQVLQTYGQ